MKNGGRENERGYMLKYLDWLFHDVFPIWIEIVRRCFSVCKFLLLVFGFQTVIFIG